MVDYDLDTVRVALHLLGVTVWVGGQIVMATLLGTLRAAGQDVPRAAARAFARVAWPAFGLAVITGMWAMLTIDPAATAGYQSTLGVKLILVVVSGLAAFWHSSTDSAPVKAVSGASGLIASLAAVVLGVALR